MKEEALIRQGVSRRTSVDERFSRAIRLDAQRSVAPRFPVTAPPRFVDRARMRRAVERTLTASASHFRIRTESSFNAELVPWERSREPAEAGDGRPAIHFRHATPMPHADTLREEVPWITQTLD